MGGRGSGEALLSSYLKMVEGLDLVLLKRLPGVIIFLHVNIQVSTVEVGRKFDTPALNHATPMK